MLGSLERSTAKIRRFGLLGAASDIHLPQSGTPIHLKKETPVRMMVRNWQNVLKVIYKSTCMYSLDINQPE